MGPGPDSGFEFCFPNTLRHDFTSLVLLTELRDRGVTILFGLENMWGAKKSREERLAGWIPCVLATTSCTLLLVFLGFLLIGTLPGDLAESSSFQDALSTLEKQLPFIVVSGLAIAHVVWSLRFAWRIEATNQESRIRGWVVHLALGAPLLIALACLLGFLGVILAIPEVAVFLLSVVGLWISLDSRRRQCLASNIDLKS